MMAAAAERASASIRSTIFCWCRVPFAEVMAELEVRGRCSRSGRRGGGGPPVSKILIFDRTASGNTPPKAVIKGPIELGNQFEIYAPKLRLVSYNRKGDIEIWKIPESGESTEPPLIIPAPPIGRYGGEIGIVLDPLHKEVIIATASGNTVVTFSVPEVFD